MNISILLAGALLLLVVSSLLLWENVASVPLRSSETDDDTLSIKELFDHAMILSKNISDLNMELHRIFVSTPLTSLLFLFLLLLRVNGQNLTYYHKYSIKTPEDIDEAQKVISVNFPYVILIRMQAWNETFRNIINLLEDMPVMGDHILPIFKNIKTKNGELLEDTKSIFSHFYGTTENVDDCTLWSGLEDFQSSDEESQFLSLCKLSYCLHVDIHTADLYLQLLKCMVFVNSGICLPPKLKMIHDAVLFLNSLIFIHCKDNHE
uniref:Prolactin family 7, subfamily a, member 1 like, pseudogene n=1 Tax=Rattus norvegicus TaxID=10116 RepID=A0A8I6G4S5_RAT